MMIGKVRIRTVRIRTVRMLAAASMMSGLAACGHPATQHEGSGSAPLRTYTASDEALVLSCAGLSGSPMRVGDSFTAARVFQGGTWELSSSRDSSPDAVRYFLQPRGEICQVLTQSQWDKANNSR